MGKRGPAKTPTAIQKAKGNPGKRPLNQDEPEYASVCPKPPSHLRELAAKEWKRLAPLLYDRGLLAAPDLAAFEVYCQKYAAWREAEDKLSKEGSIIIGKFGEQASPWVKVSNDAYRQMASMITRFGLSPSDRTQVKATKKPAKPSSRSKPKGKKSAKVGGADVISIMDGKKIG